MAETIKYMDAPEILSANELAIFLHISRAGAYNLLNSKDFPTLHVGGRKLVTKENVLLWMKKNTNGEEVPICNPSVFRKHFRKALIAAGKVRLLSPHCCRHTYVSQLQAQGVHLETIQSLTGHADVDMTEHYLHVQKEVKEDAAQKLNSVFKKGKPALHIA